jgi:diguanylate cyclase (GGDEF)-like protein
VGDDQMTTATATSLRAFTVCALLIASCCAMAQSYDAMLQKADSVHTADRDQFNNILARLDRISGQATPAQLMKLRLLHAYQPLLAGDYQASIRDLKLLLASQPDVDVRFRAGGMLVTNYAIARQFTDGLEQLQQTLQLSNRVKDVGTRQAGLLVAAVFYNQLGQYQLGLGYANRVLATPITARNVCIAREVRVGALVKLGQPPSDEVIEQAIQQCRSLNENISADFLVGFLARKWYGEGSLDRSSTLLEENIDNADATHYPLVIGEIHSLLSEVLFSKGDMAGAEQHADVAIAQKDHIANTPPLAEAYKIQYEIAEQRHDLSAALDSYQKFAQADKGYLSEVKTREMAYQIVRNENQQKNQQIELLNRQNSLLQLQQQVDQTSAQNSRLLMLLASILALVIGLWAYKTRRLSASLRLMAETDALTEVCNRHHFTQQAELCLSACGAAGEQAALIMFDLDHFKTINDSYGHVTGDWVLKSVANTCNGLCRKMDKVGRLGGEEFAILIHGSDLKSATRIAEDCRVRLSQIDSRPSGYSFPITASFGVSSTAMSGYDLDRLLSDADQMLYRAKREGRNRVRAYTPDFPMETTEPKARDHSSAMPEEIMPTSAGASNA